MSEKNTYTTIKQHEPLRVPEGWSLKEKKLIAQLEEIFDDIYARFGRLKITDMSKPLQEDIKKAANVSFEIKELEDGLAAKADKTTVEGQFSTLWQQTSTALLQKADKTTVDGQFTTLQEQTAEKLSAKADKATVEGQFTTLEEQTAEKLSAKADKATVDGQFQTLQEQTATALSTKASSSELIDLTGRVETNETNIETTAKGVTAIVDGTTPAGATKTTTASLTKDGFHLDTNGTFTVESGNFTIDEEGSMICNNATINGTLLNQGQKVLTPLDIYVGSTAPLNPRAGMVWIRPGADDEPETPSTVRTTHSWTYTQGSHTPLKPAITGSLRGSGAAPVDNGYGYVYEISIPVYIAGTVSNATISFTLGGVPFTGSVSGKQYQHPTVNIIARSSTWVASGNSIGFSLESSNGLVQTPRDLSTQITVVSRTATEADWL